MRLPLLLALSLGVLPAAAAGQIVPRDTTQPASSLDVRFNTRLEAKVEQNRNERCSPGQSFLALATCRSAFQPIFDFQFNVLTTGSVANRVHVNVDYDSQREFDGSNDISISYRGKPTDRLQRLDVGNVSFAPPPSRYITSGIPSGNYGVQATARLGPFNVRGIVAQQKGNVAQTRIFTVGDRTLRPEETILADFQFEPRRFFWTIDPTLLADYPNIDILDAQRLGELAAALPDTLRPTRVSLYRLLLGAPPPNPNGPRFIPRGARTETRGPVYEYLREGVDYHVDPSRLWVALLRPLRSNDERLVVAYNVLLADGSTVYVPTGGTPDLESRPEPQFANLLWDPEVAPTDPAFNREIRSVYRLGGDEILRETLRLRITTGEGGDREKPQAGLFDTYLQMFGLAQSGNSAEFDAQNRVWPRSTDAVFDVGAVGGDRLIRDYYLVFPSARPFAASGLSQPGNPANDSIYVTPAEDLNSARRPQVVYRVHASYSSTGESGTGIIALGSIQVRRNSERVEVDGIPVVRDVDYQIDYDLGRVTFLRPDTLFRVPRQVTARFEENSLFAATPTNIFAITTQLPLANGEINFTAIRQAQSSAFNRPTLGFEPASSLLAGVTTSFRWDLPSLDRWLQRVSGRSVPVPSRIALRGELAMSRPDANQVNQAYLESFEAESGVTVPLGDPLWYVASQPIASARLPDVLLDASRAATLAWQSNGLDPAGKLVTFRVEDIDPLTRLAGGQFGVPESLLWLTLYPLATGGARDTATSAYTWTVEGTPSGRRWRSVRTPLGASGADLSRVEQIEFWTLADTLAARRSRNPLLVIDVGDVSENSLTFSPDTMLLSRGGGQDVAAGWRGKQLQGLGALNSERDPFTRTFDATVNDIGLAGDVASQMIVLDATTRARLADSANVAVCRARRAVQLLGDASANCTVTNDRLDDEDLDADLVLNFSREGERLFRYVVDLADADAYERVGNCLEPNDPRVIAAGRALCWVHVRLPFATPTETIGAPSVRRMKAVRLTVVSGVGLPDDAFTQLAVGRLRFSGAPWIKRAEQSLTGIAGQFPAGGAVVAALIGTQDSSATIVYQPPPGVAEEPEAKTDVFGAGQVQINERSLRLLATSLSLHARAEAYYRFPEGDKSFMGYREMRLWARGRGSGWGDDGELQFFVKVGRDPTNFYMYRTAIKSGTTAAAWEPEIRVDFDRLQRLRARIQQAYLQRTDSVSGCTGLDSALIAASEGGALSPRFVACDGGYIAYTIDPGVTAPTLAAVQEMAVGMVRIAEGGGITPISPGDTLELWVDDVRLSGVISDAGFAGEVGVTLEMGGIADFRVSLTRRDRNYRQLTEYPGFATQGGLEFGTTIHLERLLPASLGLAIPLTITHHASGSDPYFVSKSDILASDIAGLRSPRSAATSWQLTARKATPMSGALAPVVNNLSLTSALTASDTRSEYQESDSRSLTLGADYDVAAAPVTRRLPGWMDRAIGWLPGWLERWTPIASLRNAEFRVNPARVRLTSTVGRSDDARVSFLQPAFSALDSGRRVNGASRLWRNGGALEIRPTAALTARVDLTSSRDFRDYGDSTQSALAAAEARGSFFGSDIGLERERGMQTLVLFTPAVSSWIRPALTLSTQFYMLHDPNARAVVLTGDTAGDARLPRRMSNSQTLGLGASFDVAKAITDAAGDSGLVGRMSRALQPVSVNVTRTLLSTFDRSPFMAPLSYQLALGGAGSFREIDGRRAANAALANTVVAYHTIALPFGLSFYDRYQRTRTHNWILRAGGGQGVIDATQRSFPDLSLGWNWQSAPGVGSIVRSVAGQVGVRWTERETFRPPEREGLLADSSHDRSRTYPGALRVAWGVFGGMVTSVTYHRADRDDQRPGTLQDGETEELSASVERAFKPRASWNFRSDIRTRVVYQQSRSESQVRAAGSLTGSRLADNGRTAITLTADSDVSENTALSLVASRVLTFDNNFNRRFTQTVISAIFHVKFFGGGIR